MHDRPLLTTEYDDPTEFQPVASSLYIFGSRTEERTQHLNQWRANVTDLEALEIQEVNKDLIKLASVDTQTIALRDRNEILSLFQHRTHKTLYLDITGLSNHVWPAILKTGINLGMSCNIVYVEPKSYAYSASPRENVIFDLSERIIGISPIPQFSNLAEPPEEDITLVPLLGFEGARFSHLIEQIQPPGDNIDPIIGIPGFRAEYPFFAYQGNQIPLKNSRSHKNVRFAKANCPFSLFYTLKDIADSYSSTQFLKIGLIGTKPHALGAVLYSMIHSGKAELVYDHTKRKPGRSSGQSHCLVYPISTFLNRMS